MGTHVCLVPSLREFHLPRILGAPKDEDDELDPLLTKCWQSQFKDLVPEPSPNASTQEIDKIKRLKKLSKKAGCIFEKIIAKLFSSISQRPFTYEQMKNSLTFFFKPYPPEGDIFPIMRVIRTVCNLGGQLKHQVALIEVLLELVFRQSIFDPEEYVSHTFAHSLTVASCCLELYQIGKIRKTFDKYHLPQEQITAYIELVAYLHDCGYPHLHGRNKTNHSIYSADKTDSLRQPLEKIFDKATQELSLTFDTFYKDMRSAIFTHNADEKNGKYSAKYSTASGDFLLQTESRQLVEAIFDTPEDGLRAPRTYEEEGFTEEPIDGRGLDLFYPKDGILGLEAVQVNLDDNPFHLVRVADNLDFSRKRLSDIQKKEDFLELCKLKYLISRGEASEQDEEYQKLAAENSPVARFETKLNADSYKHFGGCASIKSIDQLTWSGGLEVEVSIRKRKYEELNETKFTGEKDYSIASYQMFRAWKAFQYVKIGRNIVLGNGLRFVTRDEHDQLVPLFPK